MSPPAQAAPYSSIPFKFFSLLKPAVCASSFGADEKKVEMLKLEFPTIATNRNDHCLLPEHILGVIADNGQAGCKRNRWVGRRNDEPANFEQLVGDAGYLRKRVG